MKIGMLFPGYPSQFVGMGKELYDNSRIVQEHFEEASNCLNINFVKLCFASSDSEISKISNAYPSLFLVSSAVAALIKSLNLEISLMAGYGIGEYAAIYTASGISLPDGLYFVNKLASFYEQFYETNPEMKTICVDGLSGKKVHFICKQESSNENCVEISIYKNSSETIITGHTDAVEAVRESATENGAVKIHETNLEDGLRTSMATDIFEQLKVYLFKIDFKDLSIPIVSNTTGKIVTTAKEAQDSCMDQIIEPMKWSKVIQKFTDIDTIIVIAPSKFLTTELKKYYPDKTIVPINCTNDILEIEKLLSGNTENANGPSTDIQQHCEDSI